MGTKKLAWHATKGPIANREQALREQDRRAAKRAAKADESPAVEIPVSVLTVGVTRMGDYRDLLDEAWAALSLEEAREILAGTVSNDAARIPA